MKVEFAPLSVPLRRRLQTASVVQWVFSFLGLGKRHLLFLLPEARAAFPLTPSLPNPEEDLALKVWDRRQVALKASSGSQQ